MHELSLAQSIVNIVREHCDSLDPKHIARINVRMGTSAGVVAESLRFAFQALTADDPLQRAELVIDEVPFRVHCLRCATDSENPDGLGICARCGETDVEILSGTELEVASIEMGDESYEYHHD